MNVYVVNRQGEEYFIDDDIVGAGVELDINGETVLVEFRPPTVASFYSPLMKKTVEKIVVALVTVIAKGNLSELFLTRDSNIFDPSSAKYMYWLTRSEDLVVPKGDEESGATKALPKRRRRR